MEELQQLKILATQRAPGTLPFIEIYLILLENLEAVLSQDVFEDPDGVTALSDDFLQYFIVPLRAILEGGRSETAWGHFFRAAQGRPDQPLRTVLTGMYIHILIDLPRALGRAEGLKPADYQRFNHVIRASVGPSLAHLADRHHSVSARVLNLAPQPGAALASHTIKLMRRIAWRQHILFSYAEISVSSPSVKRAKSFFEYS